MTDSNGAKSVSEPQVQPDPRVLRRSVQATPGVDEAAIGGIGSLTLTLATVADDITPWGTYPQRRDEQLRDFWPSEPYLAGAVYATAIRNAAFDWALDGPPRSVQAVQDILHAANLGRGWLDFVTTLSIDLLSQDNGAFIELIRTADSPTAPVIGINHLDAARVQRTGDPRWPAIYSDRHGQERRLAWYHVIPLSEMPSPDERQRGLQICAVSRVLRAAQILRDIAIYKREKIGGRGPTAIHLVSGVGQQRIKDEFARSDEQADNAGLLRWMQPTILASLDPNAGVTHVEIPLKSLPDGFDEDVLLRWYIASLALGFGGDYQDFAPLPGGNLGTSAQSEILAAKSRGKGPALFMKTLEHAFSFHGVMPRTVQFRYDEQDATAEREELEVKQQRADLFKTYLDMGMPVQVVWQLLENAGDLTADDLALIGQEDVTEDVTGQDDEPFQEPEDRPLADASAVPEDEDIQPPQLRKARPGAAAIARLLARATRAAERLTIPKTGETTNG